MTDAWISENGIEEMQNHWFLTRRHNRIKISADTIATPEHCMLSGINYKEISPYMDIELMDAYMNRHGEYRYLSLDYSLFGGDIHGGIDTVVLYETDLGTGRPPEEIARIEYCGPDQQKNLFFQGEKVYEAGRLREQLDDCMDGYVKVEIPYNVVEKSFARDIVGLGQEEREKKTDQLILELRRKYRQGQPDIQEQKQQGFQEVSLFGGFCTIMLPAHLHDMGREHRYAKYRGYTQPDVIMTDEDADATFTFSFVGQATEGEEPEQKMKKLRVDMQKVWKQAVFYDTGIVMAGDRPVPWLDCKTFCLDGSLYCLLFLFELQGQLILGNFHCSFSQYDRWKPMVLSVLETIEEKGGRNNERLSD